MYSYYNPVRIYFGSDEINSLSKTLEKESLKYNKLLLLTGKSSLKRSGVLDKLLQQFNSSEVRLYDDIASNPDISDLLSVKQRTDDFDYDMIIAVGGGSVIDTGKSLAALRTMQVCNKSDIRKVITERAYLLNSNKCKLIAVPTTAGTGSEVTSWATIWDKEYHNKYSIEDPALYPYIAILDPGLTIHLPLKLTVTTALDALCHATEAYWSKHTSEIVRGYALNAIAKIITNIPGILCDHQSIHIREKLLEGSLMAGLAFSNTKTTACHSISYPLTLMYGIDHGVAASITLGKLLEINSSRIIELDRLLKAFGVEQIYEVQDKLAAIYELAKLPRLLRDYGVPRDAIIDIAKRSFTPGRMDNNPVDLKLEDMIDLLNSIY